uniref:Pentatricopeptide repeat-containing protein n=2 Tax=Kalanchoe fedtschenkoi TaxID=63787 RepID=A0A7N0US57_KALFE
MQIKADQMAKFARLMVSKSAPCRRYLNTFAPVAARGESEKDSSWFRRLRSIHEPARLPSTIDKWIAEGAAIKKFHVSGWVYRLRQIRMYPHALEVSQWLENNKVMSNTDRAMHIDLLSKTKGGLVKAERYFNGLKTPEKTAETFGALLNCYCFKCMTGKAVDLVEMMKEFGITPTAWNMNHLLFSHLKVGQPEKVSLLVQLMDDFGFAPDLYTYNHLMVSYADLKDYDGVEKVLEQMSASKVKPNWCTYGTLARIYIKAGFDAKATEALESIERMESLHDPGAFKTLITLYGQTNSLSGVYRVWESLNSMPSNVRNECYLSLLISLAKLGDVDGLEKYFNEWKKSHSKHDMRVYDVILKSYLDRGMLDKAELLSKFLIKKQVKPTFKTLCTYMNFYLKKGQTDIALQHLEQGATKLKERKYKDWFPDEETVNLFLKSFEDKKDTASAQKFFKITKGLNCLDSKISYSDYSLLPSDLVKRKTQKVNE